MRSLVLIALVAVTTTAYAEDNLGADWNYSKYEAYKQRLAERRANALALRRQYNASKGPAVYRTSTVYSGWQPRYVAIEQGWVKQPAIPMRPIIVVPPAAVHTNHYVPQPRYNPTPLVSTVAAIR